MDVPAAAAFLRDQVPLKTQLLFPQALKRSYGAVKSIIADTPFLRLPSAQFNHGRLVSWAVDHAIENLITSGLRDVDYRWKEYGSPRPTGSYLQILLPHSRLTISQVADPRKQPRNVVFRENARIFNSPFLPFDDIAGGAAEVSGRPSFLLIHGHQSLTFAHVAMPDAIRRYGYTCRTSNLMTLPQEVPASSHPIENTSFVDSTITLKHQIEKFLKDNGA